MARQLPNEGPYSGAHGGTGGNNEEKGIPFGKNVLKTFGYFLG
jgi:hypothetical protein